MLIFHSIWTRPTTQKGTNEIVFWDFEWLTWLASILHAKHSGEVVLVTDRRGKQFVETTGLAPFYDEIILGLDEVPETVDPEIFWAAGKLYAIPLLKNLTKFNPQEHRICSLDLDCIPWQYPDSTNEVMCLNLEDPSFAWYRDCQTKYAKFVPKYVNWGLPPANNGVFHFNEYSAMQEYAELSIEFMENFSTHARRTNYFQQPKYVYGDAMTFAEQQLMASAAANLGYPIEPFLTARNDGFLPSNAFFTHLWTTKTFYRAFPEARIHYTNQLIRLLRQNFSNCRSLLAERELSTTQPVFSPNENLTWNVEGKKHFGSHAIDVVTHLTGDKAYVRDRNIVGLRELAKGSVILPGDRIITKSSKTKIKLESFATTSYSI